MNAHRAADPTTKHSERHAPCGARGGQHVIYILSTSYQCAIYPRTYRRRAHALLSNALELREHALSHPSHTVYAVSGGASKAASPTACVIDSQSVKSAKKKTLIDPCGYNASKKIKSKKRHILVDTLDLLLHAIVHPPTSRIATHVLMLSTLFSISVLAQAVCRCRLPEPQFAQTVPNACRARVEIVKRSDKPKVRDPANALVIERILA